MEDGKIIDLFFLRDETAIREIDSKYGSYCHQIAFNILHNEEDAMESVNDTYLSAWETIPPNRPQTLSAFLGKITRNISLKRYRNKNVQKRGGGEIPIVLDELNECISSGRTLDDELENQALSEYLNSFLSTLPTLHRRVFVNRYWYLSSVSELSEKFGFSESKVKSLLHRVRKRLRIYLEEEGVSIEI